VAPPAYGQFFAFIGNSIPWIKLWKINAFIDLIGTKKAGVKASLKYCLTCGGLGVRIPA